MKKKLVTLLLALSCIFGLSALTACDDDNKEGSSISQSLLENSIEESLGEEVHTHIFNIDNKNDAYHWKECKCGKIEEKILHISVNGQCICGTKVIVGTVGLEYTLSDDETYYSVTGIGTVTDTEIVIPGIYNNLPVASIGERAFAWRSRLTSITIPDSVTSIGREAFYLCEGLTSITIPDSVISISRETFSNCHSLTSVIIGNGVTAIGYAVFEFCNSLTNVSIGNSVASIDKHAFFFCRSLTNVNIRNNVTFISEEAFYHCSSLMSINVHESNENYQSIDGNLYSKDGSRLIQYAIGKTATEFTIPNRVTSIGTYAFSGCSSLANVTIGNNVTSIGDHAFAWFDRLTSVTFENTTGWKVGETEISSTDLANGTTAATYLKDTYYTYTWTRSGE